MTGEHADPLGPEARRPRRSVFGFLGRRVSARVGVRRSTVLMAVAFCGLGALYLHVHH